MTGKEIQAKLREFENEIFFQCASKEQALDIRRRLDLFRTENNVTFEQLQTFTRSGAGEMLHMMVTMRE